MCLSKFPLGSQGTHDECNQTSRKKKDGGDIQQKVDGRLRIIERKGAEEAGGKKDTSVSLPHHTAPGQPSHPFRSWSTTADKINWMTAMG